MSDEFGDFSWEKMSWGGQCLDRLYHSVLPVFATWSGVRDPDDPDRELADGEPRAGLRPHRGCQGIASTPRHLPARAAQLAHPPRDGTRPLDQLFLAGSFLIECVFNIRRDGLLGLQAILDRDYPSRWHPVIDAFLSLSATSYRT